MTGAVTNNNSNSNSKTCKVQYMKQQRYWVCEQLTRVVIWHPNHYTTMSHLACCCIINCVVLTSSTIAAPIRCLSGCDSVYCAQVCSVWCALIVEMTVTGLHVVVCVEYLLQLAQFFIQGMSVMPESSSTTASLGLWHICTCCLQSVNCV